jgi:hypothetical protein
VVYRITVPGALATLAPLRAVALYLSGLVSPKSSAGLTQTIGGFYDATGGAKSAQMTQIVANGQPGFGSTIYVNGVPVGTNAFTGLAGGKWDNATFDISSVLGAEQAPRGSYQTQVTSSGNQTCFSWGAIVTSTLVNDSDNDGLLDTWETNGLHLNPGDATHNATFGGCADYPSDPCENLPAMGAYYKTPDIFLQLDWMKGGNGAVLNDGKVYSPHDHTPAYQVLKDIGDAFSGHAINVHFDVGNLYQGQPYIIPSSYAKGGADLDESNLLCHNTNTYTCAYDGSVYPYPVLSKNGLNLVKDGNGIPGIQGSPSPFQYGHFPYVRNWAFRYVLVAHALAGPFDPTTGKPLSPAPTSVSGVADRPGGDILITLGLWRSDVPANDQVGSILQQEGTLMHELGHTLNLRHAGLTPGPNCMVNYPSVMSYLYQTRGLTLASDGTERIDYSNGWQSANPMGESSLTSSPYFPSAYPYLVRYYAPLNQNALVNNTTAQGSKSPLRRLADHRWSAGDPSGDAC